ncbi:PD-(D/E)XK nuclease superfamily protein [Pseudobutyrivibrio sp. ACV-2]|uniref:AAA family ATPase n=1 Tax=Pseudobutyrivibrio sp. ACV-2 TaxID=1520801 RepID=UPI000896F6DF|nr:AAA family ATPase [Pseudobutyrivibrio sp. ACV-2]SEA52566.1 PD-(D/E)XK nuclease superfamily protein [Pseudobutyrivibrio sp. ACV-2]
MGTYLNPGNSGFATIKDKDYIDKTGLIRLINDTIDTSSKLTCISRPRRFGKSYAAQMLCAYYDYTCDSHSLFEGLEISKSDDYEKFINKYNVIYIDITGLLSELNGEGKDLINFVPLLKKDIIRDLCKAESRVDDTRRLSECLLDYVEYTGKKIVFIIDEWDALIREAKKNDKVQIGYLNFLREIFKNGNITPRVVAGAYMTGILPIKKDGTESAISDFNEYSILNPGVFTEYTGFLEKEVCQICSDKGLNPQLFKEWYDGYLFDKGTSIYNPYSVMQAVSRNSFESYWQKTTAAESLVTYISMNFAGLQDDIARLITGEHLEVDISGFSNDVETFKTKDDVLTLLIHLGYLAFDSITHKARIPNEEIKTEFVALLKNSSKSELAKLVTQSDTLLQDTIEQNEEKVAKTIDDIRMSEYAPTFYNDEQALRYVIKFAYLTCVDKYSKIEELPSGKGVADVVYIPQKTTADPALVIELKWNKTAEAAISQIENKNYPEIIKAFSGDILMVGINYDEKTKRHSCKINRLQK